MSVICNNLSDDWLRFIQGVNIIIKLEQQLDIVLYFSTNLLKHGEITVINLPNSNGRRIVKNSLSNKEITSNFILKLLNLNINFIIIGSDIIEITQLDTTNTKAKVTFPCIWPTKMIPAIKQVGPERKIQKPIKKSFGSYGNFIIIIQMRGDKINI